MTTRAQPDIPADIPADKTAGADGVAARYALDEQLRNARPLPAVVAATRKPGVRLVDILTTVMTGYADRPALGTRARELAVDPATGRTTTRLLPRFDTITYGQLWERVQAIAAEWYHDARTPLRAGDFVAALGFASAEYAAVDLACIRLGAVLVPLQAGATARQLAPIVAEAAPRVLATSAEYLDTAVEVAAGCPAIRRLVVFDYQPQVDDERERFEAARARLAENGTDVAVVSLADLLDHGRTLPPPPVPEASTDDRLCILIYTSGSTGTPKGAMYTESFVTAMWRDFWPREHEIPVLSVIYMPMSHLAGQGLLFDALAWGGTAYFVAKSDVSTLAEDLALARPTEVFLVPRVCDLLYQRFHSEVNSRVAAGGDRATVETEVTTELREKFLGGRILRAASTSAPLSSEMKNFVESVLQVPLHDQYGSTEAGAVLVDGRIVPRVREHKLVDVPELGYFGTDSPYPRGELLLKSETIIPGYYQRPEATAEVFDEDGFYRTGDIMAEVAPGEFVYVDRRNNVLKLSQGEFVTISTLEAVFATSPLVQQIYVYGNSERAYPLAVVVPTAQAWEQAGGDPDRVKAAVLESLQRIASDEHLNSYEIPRDVLVEPEPFTPANGLLTGIRKLSRPKLKEHYGPLLEELYRELADREAGQLQELRVSGRDQPVLDTVLRAARAVLPSTAGEPAPDAHYLDLGGDSLAALSLSTLLGEIFDVEVPVGVIMSPANDLRALAGYVERALGSAGDRPTFADVHGKAGATARAADLTLDRFIDADTLAAATGLPRPTGAPRTVLLTGANGYLGRFLCLEWLERLAPVGGTVVCIVRGSTAAAARARLDAAFATGDADLLRRYQELAAGHLEVLAGDVTEPDLGLDATTWQRLASTVDHVVHAGALVNHVLPYDQLFGPNVVGTAELIRLALTDKLKPFTYLSTVAVVGSQTSSTAEDADIRVASPTREPDDSYANGYATSKWASEVLLRNAHDAVGLPVTTFRPGLIFAHRRYGGQLNVPDMFTRLMYSLIVTGIAPGSFYRTAEPAHFDGLPVDFIAGAVTALGGRNTTGHETYNVVNAHESDGISLDTYVDWLVEAGHPIKRIPEYGEWFTRFETAIRALPERQRQHSLLPLLHAFVEPVDPRPETAVPATRFRAAVQEAPIGPDRDIPHVTADLIRKYADDLRELGLI